MGRTKTTILLALAVAVTAGACSSADGDGTSAATVPADATSSSTTTSTSQPTTTTEDPTAAVEQAFHDQWDAFVEITSDPDIENPLIDRHFTGAAKEALLDGVSRLIADQYAIRLPKDPADFAPRVTRIEMLSATEAIVLECTLDGLVVYSQTSGAVINDSVDQLSQRNDFKLIDQHWRAADLRTVPEAEAECEF